LAILRSLVETPGLRLYYDERGKWLYAEWHGPQSPESIRLGCAQVLHYLQVQKCHKLLNDNTHATGEWTEAAKWLGEHFLTSAQERGLRYVACVFAPNILSRYSTLLALEYHKQEFPWTVAFDDLATAHLWLQQCPAKPLAAVPQP
jgi:hypothetical protein